ncbi:zinc-binding dehydrogenase [Arenibaculum pallidiluteum]|uniref:zinc-binding dehydrogenase n=1 Tax=Arenibaculum pallidiluteum TaxID=2812559 RepID=UPI001A96820F|nr:zinc-binding dehydrogenase [Arenibaculum pallidiluteum]
MKAAVLGESGVEIRDVPPPSPKPNEVLVRIRACSLNRADLIMASGRMHGSQGGPGAVLGMEWAGEVVEVGAEVPPGLKPGDRVMGSGGGGYAELAATDWGRVLPVPDPAMAFEVATTLPIALQTMHDALVTNGRLAAGEAVMIQGASTGVGLMGLQIARLMGAGLVVGSSTNPDRRARLAEFGADLVVDSRDPGWPERVLQATGGRGLDLIVDQISGGVANANMKASAVRGRIVNVGRLGGFTGEFDFDLHALKRIAYIGVTFRTRSLEEVRAITAAMRRDLWPALAEGRLRLPVDRTYRLDEAAEALARMRANAHFGKIVMTV